MDKALRPRLEVADERVRVEVSGQQSELKKKEADGPDGRRTAEPREDDFGDNRLHLEEKEGEFEGLRKSLKKLKLTLSLGVRQGYLLFGFGSSTDSLAQLGGDGPRLMSRPEMKPLVRALGKRLTGIGYSSKELAAQLGTSAEDIDNLAAGAGQILEAVEVPEERRKVSTKGLHRRSLNVGR